MRRKPVLRNALAWIVSLLMMFGAIPFTALANEGYPITDEGHPITDEGTDLYMADGGDPYIPINMFATANGTIGPGGAAWALAEGVVTVAGGAQTELFLIRIQARGPLTART